MHVCRANPDHLLITVSRALLNKRTVILAPVAESITITALQQRVVVGVAQIPEDSIFPIPGRSSFWEKI